MIRMGKERDRLTQGNRDVRDVDGRMTRLGIIESLYLLVALESIHCRLPSIGEARRRA